MNYRRTSLTGKKSSKPISDRISDVAQEYRDVEIEYQLMAYLLRVNPSAAGMVQRDWFSDVLLRDMFSIVDDLRCTLSHQLLMNELSSRGMMSKDETGLYDDSVDQIFQIDVSTFNLKNARLMMHQILDLSQTRDILSGCGEIVGSMRNFNLRDAKRKLSVLARPVDLIDPDNQGMYLDDYEERLSSVQETLERVEESDDHDAGIPTGIYRFDRLIGGLMPKEFGVVAGVTGVGKTAALVGFGVHAWLKGHDVMIVSGEMSKDSLEFRLDSYLTSIPGMRFRTAELTDDDYKRWDSTIKLYRATQENILYVAAYTRRFTVEHIERDMLRIQEETGRKVQVICADYLNIMDPIRKGRGSWEDQAEAVWDFKGLVYEYNLVGWTAGQVKDDAYDKELYDSSDLKYARAISECAPVIAAIIRTDKDMIENRMKLQILKLRNAPLPSKPIALYPHLDIMRIHQDVVQSKTLRGRAADTVDETRTARRPRPRSDRHAG